MPLDIATAIAVQAQPIDPFTQHTIGWVTGSTATTVTVLLDDDGTTVSGVPKLRSYGSVNTDDAVLLLKVSGRLYCLGALNAAPTPPPPPDEDDRPPPKPTTRKRTFRPGYTGSYYRNSWRGGDLAQGNKGGPGEMRYGAAYYGKGPGSLSGEPLAGNVRIKRVAEGRDGYNVRPTLRLLNAKSRPGGFPNYSKQMQGPAMRVGETRTVSLPTSWVRALMRGNAGGIGIGINGTTPHVALAGRSKWGPAMELTIKWRS